MSARSWDSRMSTALWSAARRWTASSSRFFPQLALDITLIITSVLLMLLVLLHRAKGGGLSTLFGGGVQSSLSGSTVVEKNLDRITVFTALVWLIAILGIGFEIKFS